MNTYRKILTSSLLLATSGTVFAGGLVDDNYENYRGYEEEAEYKRVVEIEIEEEDDEDNYEFFDFDGYWELVVFGGAATMNAPDAKVKVFGETDNLSETNGSALESWTAQVGVGYVFPLFDSERFSDEVQWFPAITPSINVYYLQGDSKGDVHAFGSSHRDYADYKLKVESTRLMFDAALTVASYQNFGTYVLAGIGPSWNHLNYTANPNAEGREFGVDKVHAASTHTNFAYEFGAGVTYDVNDDIGISLQYLFVGFSDAKFEENHVKSESVDLYSNAIMLGLRWDLF